MVNRPSICLAQEPKVTWALCWPLDLLFSAIVLSDDGLTCAGSRVEAFVVHPRVVLMTRNSLLQTQSHPLN